MAKNIKYSMFSLFGLLLVSCGISSGVTAGPVTHMPDLRPQGLEFPPTWTFSAAAPATHIWGLTQYLYHLDAPLSAVQHWARQPHNACADNTEPNFEVDNSLPKLLWFCADADRLYSLLQWDTTVLWAVSERQGTPEDAASDHFTEFLRTLGAEQLHQSSTAFEQVSVYQTPRTLLALQADLDAYSKRHGLQVNTQQSAHNGLIMSWQQGPLRTEISAIRQADGRVVLTRVTGTNL